MSAEEHIHYIPESPGIDNRAVLLCALGALILLAGTIAGFHEVYRRGVPVKDVLAPQAFPQPRVVTSQVEVEERRRLTGAQQERLETWRWANDQHTLVQTPIERAMQLLVQKGAAAYNPLLPPPPPERQP
ncbi:MAG TPA: hypothetical protein VK749_27135 [Xanthobacteraceae bacterium]|jgi:hypothetical protein|nr:hypothetical protein [Xanthobacteraceae bacterium]